MPTETVFMAMPTYGAVEMAAATSWWANVLRPASSRRVVNRWSPRSSLLAKNHNVCWIEALRSGCDWAAFCHSDVSPSPGWVDTLIDEAQRIGADVMGAPVLICDQSGDTSLAVDNPDDFWRPKRLSVERINRLAVDSFKSVDIGGQLLINTGCFVADLRKPEWLATRPNGLLQISFCILDGIRRKSGSDELETVTLSEDWNFSLQCHHAGLVVGATRLVRTIHFGQDQWLYAGPSSPSGSSKQLQMPHSLSPGASLPVKNRRLKRRRRGSR